MLWIILFFGVCLIFAAILLQNTAVDKEGPSSSDGYARQPVASKTAPSDNDAS